ncbi:MAG TPA: MFS transporter [Anaerolineales bacterium]|nr:MFS transporter [Anaerolineales bacterium]
MFRVEASKVYYFIEFTSSAFFSMMFVVISLYEATVAGLTPMQLVLVGTTLEVSAFLFEIPTGVVADVFSRRLSIIIGYIMMGVGFLVEGLFPSFLPILLAQVIWGVGYTFTSGATQAWITDEVGEEKANPLFMRAARAGLVASLIGMGATMLIGANNAAMPIIVGAIGVILIGIVLIFIMPETGFKPTPMENRSTWQHMWHTFNEGVKSVKARPRLMNILGVGFFYGLYSEGFDRLWVKHLLDTFQIPVLFGGNQVAFFSLLRFSAGLLTVFVMQLIEKRVDASSPLSIGRAMIIVTGGIAVGIVGFALSPLLPLTLGLYLTIYILRQVRIPLQTAWVNHKLDPQTRATVHSMTGQVDSIGQILGGGSAFIARYLSVVAAITTSGILLGPALGLVRRANSQSTHEAEVDPVGELTGD